MKIESPADVIAHAEKVLTGIRDFRNSHLPMSLRVSLGNVGRDVSIHAHRLVVEAVDELIATKSRELAAIIQNNRS